MAIFRDVVVVGVSSAIALLNIGPSIAESSLDQPQNSQASNTIPTQHSVPTFTPHIPESQQLKNLNISHTVPLALDLSPQTPELPPLSHQVANLSQLTPLTPEEKTPIPVPSDNQPPAPTGIEPIREKAPPANSPSPDGDPQISFPPLFPNGTLKTNPPEYLEPNPNPLNFPTKPEEVQILKTEPISLLQAIDLARRNNPTLRVVQLQLDQSRASLREARASLYPDITFQMDFDRSKSAASELSVRAQLRRLEDAGESTKNGPENLASNTVNNTLQLSYDVDLFGRRYASIQAAGEQVRIRELEVERLTEQLRFDVTDIYLRLQQSDGLVKIGEAAVRNSQKSLKDAESLERAGVGTRFAVLQSQVQVANDQQRLIEARRDQRINRRRLAEQLNINQEVELIPIDSVRRYGFWELSLEQSIVLAFKNRVELEQQLVQRDRNEQLRRVEIKARLPRLNLFARYNVLGIDPDEASNYATRGWADGYSLGARISWDIFDGGAANARATQRDIDKKIAEANFDDLRNQIRREVEQAYFELNSSAENIQTAEIGVTQATEALRLARLRFQAGVGTQTDVINQETDLTRSQVNLLTAVIGYNRALSSLIRAVSNLPSNTLTNVP